jgi:biotin synthase-like enzyme
MVPWYAKGEVGEYLIHALDLIQDGQINDAISVCLSVGMSDEEIDEFLAAEGVAQ